MKCRPVPHSKGEVSKMKPKNNRCARPLRKRDSDIPSDVLGSYTGVTNDGALPEQDPDDLK